MSTVSLPSRNQRAMFLPLVLGTIALSVIATRTSVLAQSDTIRIEAGQTVEIGTDSLAKKPDFSWVLTKDRKFQGAQRLRFFQARLPQVGTYTLDVSVQDPLANQNDYRAFTIIVTDPKPIVPSSLPLAVTTDTPTKAVLQTEPAAIDGTLYVSPEGAIAKIDPSKTIGKIASFKIDLDSTVDSDGDGNPTNDNDTQDTFLERGGSAIYYFFLSSNPGRQIILTVLDTKGQSDTTSLNVVFGAPPTVSLSSQDTNSPISFIQKDLTAAFHAEAPLTQSGSNQLLYEWDFGDQKRSLLTQPEHTYAAPGMYTVGLTIRDIQNGQILFAGTTTVEIAGSPILSSSAQSQASESAPSMQSSISSAGSTQTGTKLPLGSIMKVGFIVFLLLAFAIGLYALFTWIKRKTTGSLEQTLEKMEQTMLKQDTKITTKVEPMKLRKEPAVPAPKSDAAALSTVADQETSHSDFRTKERANVTPVVDNAPVPSWLAKAATKPTPSTVPTQAPTPVSRATPENSPKVPSTPAPQKPEEKPTPAPAPSKQPAPAPAAAAPVPDWLKPVSAPKAPLATPSSQPEAKPAEPQLKPQPAPTAPPKQATIPPPQKTPLPTTPPQKPVVEPPAVTQPRPQMKPQPQPAKQESPKIPAATVQKPATPPPPQKPTTPSPKPLAPAPMDKDDTEPPIAIIQADSLTK